MSGEALWNRIIVLPISGQEIQTTTGLWFKASSIDGRLYIDKAVDHAPSSELSMQRSMATPHSDIKNPRCQPVMAGSVENP